MRSTKWFGGKVLDAAKSCGAQGATVSYARYRRPGQDGVNGVTIDENKEVVRIIVSAEQAELVFESMYMAAELDTPGKGIMYLSELDKIATYVPDNVLDTVGDK